MQRLLLIAVFFQLISCNSNADFQVEKGRVGPLDSNTEVKDLKNIFAQDSLVKKEQSSFLVFGDGQASEEYIVYSEGGELLLKIIPEDAGDSISLIDRVEILSPLFKTDGDVGLGSTFEQVNFSHTINKAEKSLSSAVLFMDELNATMTLSKDDLGIISFRPGSLDLGQIPDNAPVKTFVVWLN